MMLIHFPAALLPMDLVCSFLGLYYGPTFIHASFFAMAGGVVLGVLAVITGTFDLLSVLKDNPDAVKKALIHGSINTLVIIGYSVLAWIAFKQYPGIEPDSWAKLMMKGCLVTFMIVANHLGGSLILKDKVGVERIR